MSGSASLAARAGRATRDAYGDALLELGEIRPDVVVLDADLSRSTKTEAFGRRFPDRFFNVGIAEQHMIGMAAGLSMAGFVPFATTYAIFIARALDQIRQAVCFGRCPVKIVATHGGLAASHDGGTHQGIEDIALMRAMPHMTVLVPADYAEARQAVLAAAVHPGPVYLRLQKEPVPDVTAAADPFVIGQARLLREGDDVAVFVTGSLVHESLRAADVLASEGVRAAVLALPTLAPLDAAAVRELAARCGCVVTVEEHLGIGGLHDAVLHAIAGDLRCPAEAVAMSGFGTTGEWAELREKFGLDPTGIAAAARRAVARRARA
jgi:transketolase